MKLPSMMNLFLSLLLFNYYLFILFYSYLSSELYFILPIKLNRQQLKRGLKITNLQCRLKNTNVKLYALKPFMFMCICIVTNEFYINQNFYVLYTYLTPFYKEDTSATAYSYVYIHNIYYLKICKLSYSTIICFNLLQFLSLINILDLSLKNLIRNSHFCTVFISNFFYLTYKTNMESLVCFKCHTAVYILVQQILLLTTNQVYKQKQQTKTFFSYQLLHSKLIFSKVFYIPVVCILNIFHVIYYQFAQKYLNKYLIQTIESFDILSNSLYFYLFAVIYIYIFFSFQIISMYFK